MLVLLVVIVVVGLIVLNWYSDDGEKQLPVLAAIPSPTATATPTPDVRDAGVTAMPQPTSTAYSAVTATPTLVPLPTHTSVPPAPTYTARPTSTPVPTSTPEPTATPAPTFTPVPTATPTPTPTRTPRPTPTPTSTPQPLLTQIHDTQNTRWLVRNYPAIARQIRAFPWAQDGLSALEVRTIDRLLYLGVGDIGNLRQVLGITWVQDDITDTEHEVLYWIEALDDRDSEAAGALLSMPFLEFPDGTDVLAIRGMYRLAHEDALSTFMDSSLFRSGIDNDATTLVAAVGTLYQNPDAIPRVLTPGNVAIESVTTTTELTPELKISIVRTGSQSRPGTVDAVQEAVVFAERLMGLPLPTSHVIVLLDDSGVTKGYAGTNYGFAFSYSPEYETRQGTYEWRQLQAGFVHEVAHYYWRGSEDWIDEGVANTFEYIHGIENGVSRGYLKTKREDCEAHDLEMLVEWAPPPNSAAGHCNYYLGEQFFLELLETLGIDQFTFKLQELYSVVRQVYDAEGTAGIDEVRQVFTGQSAIVDRHWAGALNAPENRPFDEGVSRTNHDVVQWDQHPIYDGNSVTFSGVLLDGAVLSSETVEQARGGGPTNFSLTPADAREYVGSILPPLLGGRYWTLDDPGDSVASTYSLDATAKSFTVTFPFPSALGSPSDYVVLVWGFLDDSRTRIDLLGYARIRTETR